VGEWPKDLAIERITRVVVYTGAIVDSVRITYQTTGGPKTVQHGGNGGLPTLDFSLTGNFYFALELSNLLTPLALQLIRRLLLFMVATSIILVYTERKSTCPRLFTSQYYKANVILSFSIVQLSFIIGTKGADGKGAATCEVKSIFSSLSHCKLLMGSRQLLLQEMSMVPTPNSTSVGLSWESLHTTSNQVNGPHFTSISLLTSYTEGMPNSYLQGIGFTEVLSGAAGPI
jgi:hypothetical protein